MASSKNAAPKIETYREIEVLYEQQNLPILEEMSLRVVREFFAENGCENIGGSLVFGEPGAATSEAKSMYRDNLIDQRNDTFVGPYLLGKNYETYEPNGIGVWTTGKIGPIR